MVMADTNVDPTVIVNLFNIIRSIDLNSYPHYKDLLSIKEYVLLAMQFAGLAVGSNKVISYLSDGRLDYYSARHIDVNKYFSGQSNDLTGGTLRDRFDYNRPEFHDVFKIKSVSKLTKEHSLNSKIREKISLPVKRETLIDAFRESVKEIERI